MTFYKLGLIGYPLGHSLSPKIHTAALKSVHLKGEYSLFPISPDDHQGLENLLAHVRNGEIAGLNVTIPHKQNVIPLMDELSETASAVGAVNTIYEKDGNLFGDNTDVAGYLADLHRFLGKRKETKKALVLGAGGSARAVIYALLYDGWDVTIAARRQEQANELISQFPNHNSQLSSIEYPISLIPSLSLIVNTTPLGMSPNIAASPYPQIPFPANAAIYDLVYNPRETKLAQDAQAAGLPAITGLGMLIEQAALSFEIWTERKLSRQPLYEALEEV